MKNNYSIAYQRQLTSSLKLFFSQIENRNINPDDLQHPRKKHKLTVVYSKTEIKAILNSIRNIKHKTAIAILYGAGLRISELLNIRLEDIDLDRKRIHIRGAKGKKDRYANLSDRMNKMINVYTHSYHPKKYLFDGQFGEQYSASSCRQVLKRAMKAAYITKSASLHTLRHSYATHLHERGTDIHHIQALLGHKSVKTTEIYTHISKHILGEIKSPLDDL